MGNNSKRDEKLVVEVVAAHNLMPKDGQGSSSPFVEVEFEHQKLRTTPKPKSLNPVWNERLVFSVSNPDDLPYRSIDFTVFNDRSHGTSGRNFLGKLRIPASGIPAPGEAPVPQLFTLEKRSLFSHIRGEITLKLYRTFANSNPGDQMLSKNNSKKPQQQQMDRPKVPSPAVVNPPITKQQPAPPVRRVDPTPMDIKPVVLATGNPPAAPANANQYPVPGFAVHNEFGIKETRPHLGGGDRDKTSATYDLVETMEYLYIRIVRARDVPVTAGDPHAEVRLGNYRGMTLSNTGLFWNQVFAFSKDCVQSSTVEVHVKLRGGRPDDFIGRVVFDLGEVPKRVPPDSTLAPQWYRMEDKKGDKLKAEVMVSVWFGTQADESFAEAWHSRAAAVHGDGLNSIKSKVYMAPKLWYLRVSIIEAQDLVPGEKGAVACGRFPELFAKAQVGGQTFKTRVAVPVTNRLPSNPCWNEDLLFVVAEPFEDMVMITVDDRVGPNRDETLGRVVIPVSSIERRLNDKPLASRWFPLDRSHGGGDSTRFGSRVHLRLSLDGGYHVLDESTAYSSDLRPTAKVLWPQNVGVLELGILGATGLMPMKIRDGRTGATDAYCVAKYGQKWIRTRTVVDSMTPRWNEQYTWEVFDPCTVITIGVFDNCHIDKAPGSAVVTANANPNGMLGPRDSRIGKVRIRLSTLETDRVYTHAYPLLMLHPSGVKKMGELNLAVRFSCASSANMLHAYVKPLLPKMHYVEPLLVRQIENLRFQATNVVIARLGRAEPPLGREIVEYMLDHGSHLWSMRKSKANFLRLVTVLSGPVAFGRLFDVVCSWQRPVLSVVFLLAYITFVLFPDLILPTAFLIIAITALWRYRSRPRTPPHMDTRLSQAEMVFADELDEEFDTFPTSRGPEVVRMRYDRLRAVAGKVQTVVGDMGTQGERVLELLSWRDPRATFLFMIFCLVAAVVFYAVPMKVVVGLWGLYAIRPPRFRSKLPSPALNFFRRIPTKVESLL